MKINLTWFPGATVGMATVQAEMQREKRYLRASHLFINLFPFKSDIGINAFKPNLPWLFYKER